MRLPPMRPLKEDVSASAAVVSFMVGAAIFLAAIGAVLVATQDVSDPPAEDQLGDAGSDVAAEGLAAILVGSSGVWGSGDVDDLGRLGLLSGNGSGLDPTILEAMRGGKFEPLANDKIDYPEALESLGMATDGTDGFHVRIYPLGDLGDLEVNEDLSVGYIADWSSLATVKVNPPVLTTEGMAVKANVALNTSMVAGTIYERQALRSLGVDFTDRVYITLATPKILVDYAWPLSDRDLLDEVLRPLYGVTVLEGDVYPDDKGYLDATLTKSRLTGYDVIVVGSGVDHGKLVDLKERVKDWVLAGGTLIVLGSADKSTAWLNPLLNAGISTVNGAAIAPDIAHPLLKQPNDLDWIAYDTHDRGWDIQESGAVAAYDDFSHVVIQGSEDVLAVSKAGSFGAGRVLLTSYYPRDIAPSLGQPEADHFIENMVSYADRSSLYLDYGGTIPLEQPVALAVRQSWIWDEVYGSVPVRVEVLVWG